MKYLTNFKEKTISGKFMRKPTLFERWRQINVKQKNDKVVIQKAGDACPWLQGCSRVWIALFSRPIAQES
jgi:hypothetical protein